MPVGFYAGLRRSERQIALLLGPYATRDEASAHVARAHTAAIELDRWCHFDAAGVFRVTRDALPAGVLNARIGLESEKSV